jgi:hypothetical protein
MMVILTEIDHLIDTDDKLEEIYGDLLDEFLEARNPEDRHRIEKINQKNCQHTPYASY